MVFSPSRHGARCHSILVMPDAKTNQRVFVDFENVPAIDLGLIAGQSMHVTLLIGKNQSKLDFALVQQIHALAQQVELIAVGAAGRNALDMTLAHYLGRALQQHPRDHFHIVSGDKDYDPLIAHLVARGVKVSRHGSFSSLPGLSKSKHASTPPKPAATGKAPAPTVALDRRAKLIARLSNRTSRNRPASRQTLIAHIKNNLSKDATEATVLATIDELRTRGVLTIDDKGKVIYA